MATRDFQKNYTTLLAITLLCLLGFSVFQIFEIGFTGAFSANNLEWENKVSRVLYDVLLGREASVVENRIARIACRLKIKDTRDSFQE